MTRIIFCTLVRFAKGRSRMGWGKPITPMSWARSCRPPIVLKDGRKLSTLREATTLCNSRAFIRERPVWVYGEVEGDETSMSEVRDEFEPAVGRSRILRRVVSARALQT